MSQTPSQSSMDVLIYHNGNLYDKHTPLLSPLDLSVIRGYAICDTFRTYNKTPFLLERHIDRFISGAKAFSIPLNYSKEDLVKLISEMIEKAEFETDEIVGKLLLTPGVTNDTYFSSSLKPQLFIILSPFTPFPESCYTQGVKLKTIPYTRPMPSTKHTSYHCPLQTLFTLANPDIHDALYVNDTSHILEAGTSNFFLIDEQGTLTTAPASDVLSGTTREFILELAHEHKLPVNLTAPSLESLNTAKAAFITSCNRGIIPVSQIDDIKLPDHNNCETLQKLKFFMKDYIIKKYFYNTVDV